MGTEEAMVIAVVSTIIAIGVVIASLIALYFMCERFDDLAHVAIDMFGMHEISVDCPPLGATRACLDDWEEQMRKAGVNPKHIP